MKVYFYVDVYKGQKDSFYANTWPPIYEKTTDSKRYKFFIDIPEEIPDGILKVENFEEER